KNINVYSGYQSLFSFDKHELEIIIKFIDDWLHKGDQLFPINNNNNNNNNNSNVHTSLFEMDVSLLVSFVSLGMALVKDSEQQHLVLTFADNDLFKKEIRINNEQLYDRIKQKVTELSISSDDDGDINVFREEILMSIKQLCETSLEDERIIYYQ
ncbi:unnamed protein product, partial [Didymodactylos carnosus]